MKKITAALLSSVLMMSMVLSGCGADKKADQPATGDGANTASETIIMSTNAQFPPYEMHEGDEIVGIDAEIAAAIAEKIGMKLEISDMDFEAAIVAAQTGQSDFVMAGLTVNEERKENLNFTESYATGIQVIIVKEDSAMATADDLAGKQIGVQQGTTGHIYCSDDFGDDKVTAYANGALAVEALKNDQVDCVVIDSEPAKAFVAANEGLKILETEYVVEDYAIGIAKDNAELLEKMNTALKELKEDGTVQSIIDKYIVAE